MGWRYCDVRFIVSDGNPIVRGVTQRIRFAACTIPRRRRCLNVDWWWWRRADVRWLLRFNGSGQRGRTGGRLKVGMGAPTRGSREVEMRLVITKQDVISYLMGGGGGGGGCLAAGGRDEGREPVPGVGERSRIFEGCSGSKTSSSEPDSSV